MIRIYLSGPMSGIKNYNYPAFNREAKRIRKLGYHVENPAENTPPEDGQWSSYMRIAIGQMMTCDWIALLPGWLDSQGAAIECKLAYDVGMVVKNAEDIR